MACCLMAPSHYLNQCWLIINKVSWHSCEGNFTGKVQDIYPWYQFKISVASLKGNELTHWGRDKMAVIFADDIFKCIFINENLRILMHISLKFGPSGPVYNNPSLVQIMTWRRAGNIISTNDGLISLKHMCDTSIPQYSLSAQTRGGCFAW